jgi:heme/copper-type cytochrome/quinol oxidase subunit 2
MKRSLVTGIIALCFIVAGCAGQNLTSLEGMPFEAPVQKVLITGEDCGWSPNLVKVEKGTHVILDIESVDWDYNFKLDHYNLAFEVPKGEKVTAEFYADDTGEFEYGCYIETGQKYFWGGMIGKLIVK